MTKAEICDVAVIGGGPAGSSFAGYARLKGLTVTLFERERFPRDHVGESLIPFTYGKLKELGVLEDIRRFATYKPGVNFVDTDGVRQSTWCFGQVLKDASSLSFHTLRAPFDKALLDNARRLGAVVHEETAVTGVDLDGPGGLVHVETRGPDGTQRGVQARFLVDASGQGTFLARTLGHKHAHRDLDRVAFFCHWIGNDYDDALRQGLIKIIYLGGSKKGWIWVIPVGRDHLSIGVTLNNDYVREMRAREGAGGSRDWMRELYLAELNSARGLAPIIRNARLEHDVLTIGDYSYYAERKFGPNYALVGDAGAFLDPIFSSGIYVALETASRVAGAVHVKLRLDDKAGDAMLAREYETIDGAYALIEKFIRLFYSPDVLNFAHVDPATGTSFDKFLSAYNIFHYLLAGDFFENHRKYAEFIDTIRSERGYNRFIDYVHLKHGRKGELTTCGYTYNEIYGHLA